jgi:general secretion pathway protein K
MHRRERGVALVTVLLVVALATLVASHWLVLGQVSYERQRERRINEQAWQLGLAMEAWASGVLAMDNRGLPQGANAGYDSPDEPWARPMPPVDVEQGRLAGVIEAADGKLNLNALADPEIEDLSYERLLRLLEVLQMDRGLADVIADYIDADSQRRELGAEDISYQGLVPARRAANQALAHISELRHVARMTEEQFQRLAAHVTVLPLSARLNINLASPEVLRAVIPQLQAFQAERVAGSGFRSLQALQQQLPPEMVFDQRGLDVQSQFFRAHGRIWLDATRFDFYVLLAETGRSQHRRLYRSLGID